MKKLNLMWADLRGNLWLVPAIMIIVSIAGALCLIEIDSAGAGRRDDVRSFIFGLDADGARGMLTAIAGSMLTVAALTFSLTLNAVSQASVQFTARIFRNFMRDRTNQVVLGYFVSVFAYCLVVLQALRGGDNFQFVPSVAVAGGLVLAIGGVFVLVVFIHHIAVSLQITTILDNIADETKQAVEGIFPSEGADESAGRAGGEAPPEWEGKAWKGVAADTDGYIQSVDKEGLLKLAEEKGLVVRMCRGIGTFVGRGSVLAEVASASDAPAAGTVNPGEIRQMFRLGSYRTIEQDVGYGLRQIVDIALKGLSPAVNDTTTAVNCIDNLSSVIGEIARRPMPEKVWSSNGVPRVLVEAPDFSDYVKTGFDQIRMHGKANQAIFERLLEALTFVGTCTAAPDRRKILLCQADLVGEYAAQTLETDYERENIRLRLAEAKRFLAA